ncbi:type III-B CRISPR-associated protein Cas10/Cmr2 [Crocosphaera sp. XPORK-15E]|uniref:type III-B CRISPR-associated protein Cas10/Cmr2 n=1 Tax=Crocosphaera sp. XPORK-15E TaxID=3110247 RepID=UPI002B1EE598|nr:type III-B CRISPR-associated protein Cas10/Cmr2 [Crocosphaera sp. XPORK-15E]MEA5537030.1 type III-B CRISPR-associated protein Cas10/Cmr2 [Crocosphaera sp. XPORK-15E]
MSHPYWQAKIWGLLHDPALKALYPSIQMNTEGQWDILACMEGWTSPKPKGKQFGDCPLQVNWLKYVGLCDLISSASDRSTIGRLDPKYSAIQYTENGLDIHHLLSGKPQTLKVTEQLHQRLQQGKRKEFLEVTEREILNAIKEIKDPKTVFWWLWRCYPEKLAQIDPNIALLPAETRLPDGSLWSHVSMTSALAGALAGYYKNNEDYPQKNKTFSNYSRPHLVTITFTPVQELIKASRKMRDFWAGSWILHYLSAKVCWELANKYGPDTILYPCLYDQPLIDHWLFQTYPNFDIKSPKTEKLLTAGFPNVIVMVLPDNGKTIDDQKDNPIYAATQYAKQVLLKTWKELGDEVLKCLQEGNEERKGYEQWKHINPKTWQGWLDTQWQYYWVSYPVGYSNADLSQSPRKEDNFETWVKQQNLFTNLTKEKEILFEPNEEQFIREIFNLTENTDQNCSKQPNMNVGSWWGYLFKQMGNSLKAVKNARNWELPTVFTPRSTISGLGSVVCPNSKIESHDWIKEGETKSFWQQNYNLFDGIEQLNASEVVKRGLHQILGKILYPDDDEISSKVEQYYPDLSSGVAGWLRSFDESQRSDMIKYYKAICKDISDNFNWVAKAKHTPWGIPLIDNNTQYTQLPNPRLLNAGWLIEDYTSQDKDKKDKELKRLRETISHYFSTGKNPTDWYVLAAGDGDGMGDWLTGSKLQPYKDYMPQQLLDKIPSMPEYYQIPIENFIQVKKRMGPATHSSLSRALLDFSNQLVPYLTEERYAGRLIYSGGDDVLACTNLWEWDNWLWDIRQCFRGDKDPLGFDDDGNFNLGNCEFKNDGDYWQWNQKTKPQNLTSRPLFTMGGEATISFGIVIAHHSVPLAIALENLWKAEGKEEGAKKHKSPDGKVKDAVQVRVLYGNGNILKSTAKFDIFYQWQRLIHLNQEIEPSLFEQAATLFEQHPIPDYKAIEPWTKAFCSRREQLKTDTSGEFQKALVTLFQNLWLTTPEKELETEEKKLETEVKNWLKLAAFVLRNRQIKIGGHQ